MGRNWAHITSDEWRKHRSVANLSLELRTAAEFFELSF